MDERTAADDIATQGRGVIASIALSWYATNLVMLWFLLEGDTVIAATWLGIQMSVVSGLAVLGWAHLKASWTGSYVASPSTSALWTTCILIIASFGGVYVLHGLIAGPVTSH